MLKAVADRLAEVHTILVQMTCFLLNVLYTLMSCDIVDMQLQYASKKVVNAVFHLPVSFKRRFVKNGTATEVTVYPLPFTVGRWPFTRSLWPPHSLTNMRGGRVVDLQPYIRVHSKRWLLTWCCRTRTGMGSSSGGSAQLSIVRIVAQHFTCLQYGP